MHDPTDARSTIVEPEYAASDEPAATIPAEAPPDEMAEQPVALDAPPGSERGAFVALTQAGDVRLSLVFTQSPQTIVRDRERGGKGISETFTIAFAIDAADDIAAGDPSALAHGIHPALAALDQLFREAWVILLYGPSRAIPMTPIEMNVTETAFDESLNPIRAEVTFRAERITLTSDLNLGKYVNAAAATTHALMRLYKPADLPPIRI